MDSGSDDGFGDRLSSSDEDGDIAQQDLQAMRRNMHTEGYLHGIEAGKEHTLQQGFDEGFCAGLRQGQRPAELRALLQCLVAQLRPRGDANQKAAGSSIDSSEAANAACSRALALIDELTMIAGQSKTAFSLESGDVDGRDDALADLSARCQDLFSGAGIPIALGMVDPSPAAASSCMESETSTTGVGTAVACSGIE